MRFLQPILVSALFLACTTISSSQSSSTPPASAVKPALDLPDAPEATPTALAVPNGPTVVMDTSMGRITCQFYQRQAPKAVANFIGLATGTIDWTDPKTHRKQ